MIGHYMLRTLHNFLTLEEAIIIMPILQTGIPWLMEIHNFPTVAQLIRGILIQVFVHSRLQS